MNVTLGKSKITWKQAQEMIKTTGRFVGFMRYRNEMTAFDSDKYPFASEIADKIKLLARTMSNRGDYRGKGVSLWIEQPDSIPEPDKQSEITIRKSELVLSDSTTIDCISPISIVISDPTFPVARKLCKEDIWGTFDTETMTQISSGMIVASSGDRCPHFADVAPYASVTVVCKLNEVEDVSYWLEFVQGAGCIKQSKQINDLQVAIRADYMCW